MRTGHGEDLGKGANSSPQEHRVVGPILAAEGGEMIADVKINGG